jgi:hypothetical protein
MRAFIAMLETRLQTEALHKVYAEAIGASANDI